MDVWYGDMLTSNYNICFHCRFVRYKMQRLVLALPIPILFLYT